ncbi:FAD-dependent thymidylate synthase [Synechococcus sp. PCC 7336]|uniref:FAD-dependent thymidylate synthase n=1 Tax=Synechococcus sp. PCC 7336 TaxID=195250 RepID=UPI00034B5E1E|nr:FAD-dependent thymidylate synthase [Synechococcus sp. PCC 7336]
MDSLFEVVVLNQTPDPERVIYQAMHQDYSSEYITPSSPLPENYGEVVIKRLLEGNRGHYGPLEHPQITFGVGNFPHAVMQQARTHRVGVSFDVQCLAANTEITFVDKLGHTGSKLKKTLGELYELWEQGEIAIRERHIRGRKGEPPGTYRRDCKRRIQKMRLRVLNETTGEFEAGHIKTIMSSGIQPIYRLTLADGKTLNCTVNHRLHTPDGWQRMADAVELEVDANNRVVSFSRFSYLTCNGILVSGNELYRDRHWLRQQIEAGCLEQEFAQGYQPIASVDSWSPKPLAPGRRFVSHPVRVAKVEYLGMQPSYDIEVDGPWHNFIANGVVVHNSFRYTGANVAEVGAQLQQGVQPDRAGLDKLFYLPETIAQGQAKTRQGMKPIAPEAIEIVLEQYRNQAIAYHRLVNECGVPYEDARNVVGYGIRQHFVVSFNCRSLMHFLDLRAKADAQTEIRHLCELMMPHFKAWCPHTAEWYLQNRWGKARLSP